MARNPIIHRKNYVVRDTNPTTGRVEFNRVRATIMELELLGRYFRANDLQYSFYKSRFKDQPTPKNGILRFEEFMKKRGLNFSIGRIVQSGTPEVENNGNGIFYTTVVLLLACAIAAVVL